MKRTSISKKIHKIKPKVLFHLIEQKYPNKNNTILLNIPPSEIGGLTLLEHTLLISIIKLVKPDFLFEFGTYLGATSVVMAANSSENARVYTLDIPQSGIDSQKNLDKKRDDIINDNFLRE